MKNFNKRVNHLINFLISENLLSYNKEFKEYEINERYDWMSYYIDYLYGMNYCLSDYLSSNQGDVYEYFESKSDLINYLVNSLINNISSSLDSWNYDNVEENIDKKLGVNK